MRLVAFLLLCRLKLGPDHNVVIYSMWQKWTNQDWDTTMKYCHYYSYRIIKECPRRNGHLLIVMLHIVVYLPSQCYGAQLTDVSLQRTASAFLVQLNVQICFNMHSANIT